MSEEINFDRAWKMLHIYLQSGKTEMKVSVLPNSLQKIAKAIGYKDNDTIPLLTLKEYLQKLAGSSLTFLNTPEENGSVSNGSSGDEEKTTLSYSTEPSKFSGSKDTITEKIGEKEFSLKLNHAEPLNSKMNQSEPSLSFEVFERIIKRIDSKIYPSTMIPLYILYLNGRMSRSALLNASKKFARSIGLSESSAKRALSEISKDHLLVNKHIIDGEEFLELSSSLLSDIKFYLRELEAKKEEEEKQKKGMDREVLVERSARFLREYVDNEGRKVYIDRLIDLLTLKSSKSLVVDWYHLDSFDSELAKEVIEHPEEVIGAFEDAVLEVLREPPILYEGSFRPHVRFTNLPQTLKVREVGSEHINKLIQIEGVVSRQVEHRPFVERAVFVCNDCGNEMVRLQRPYEPIVRPPKCDACGSRNIELDVEKSRFVDAQWFRVQELPQGEDGVNARFIKAIVLGDLVDTFLPGDKVRVVGILRVRMTKKNGIPIMDKVLEVNNVEVLTKRIQDVELDEARIQEIKRLAKERRDKIVDLIVNSIAPSIYGYEDVKKGIALALFSGGDVVAPDGTVTRGASHVLLVGDPGTAKSTISRFLKQVIPRGIWTTAKTSSAAGLTATAVQDKETGTWTLEAGALVLANGGICVIDEFDKMSDKDRAAIHEALEQGTISVSKAGINVVLPARTTVIAIGNPKYGRFDPHRDKDKPLVSQIDLPPTLLSRFDLIFPIIDIPQEQRDRKIAEHILGFKVGVLDAERPRIEHLPADLLRDYIAYARNYVNPVLTKEAYEFLVDYYEKTRARAVKKDGTVKSIPITARQLEGLWRLARARARMRLSERIELEDVKDVVGLFERNMRRLITDEEGELDITILEAGKSTREIDREATAVSIIEKLEAENDEGAPYEDVVELLAQKLNAPKTEAKKVIERLIEEGRIYMPRVGFLRISSED